MSTFDWNSFLRQWSQAILESMTEEQLSQLPPDVIESQWLGYPGATEPQLAQVEAQLRMPLPPSYREFLKVSNGWRQTTPFIHKLWSTEGIALFASRHLQWIEAFTETHESAHLSFDQSEELDGLWEPLSVSDDEYFIYGEEQDCSQMRLEYLKTAIEISDVGQSAIYLLNPQVVSPSGEWEAWFFADWLPGADRYRSFQEMMEAEYQNFLELRDTVSEPVVELSEPSLDRVTQEVLASPLEFLAVEPSTTSVTEPEVWRSLKRLTIEFQTRQRAERREYRTIASAGSSYPSHTWSGLKLTKLQSWLRQELTQELPKDLVDQAVGPVESGIPDQPASPPSTVAPTGSGAGDARSPANSDLVLEVDQLEIRQNNHPPVQIRVNSAKFKKSLWVSDSLISQLPFSMEMVFKLAARQSPDPGVPSVTYKARLYAQNRMTGQWIILGETQAGILRSDRHTYTAHLNSKALDPGLYRLQVFTTFQGSATALTSFELPLLNVV